MQQVVVSQQTGYARNASESAYPNLWRGLVGWWCPSINPRGGNRLFDLSPFGNTGTLTNMTNDDWVVSGGAGALDFENLSDDFVSYDSSKIPMAEGAVSVWVHKVAATALSNDYMIWTHLATNTDRIFFELQTYVVGGNTNPKFLAGFGVNDPPKYAFSTTFSLLRWYHLVLNWKNGFPTQLYQDGVLVGTSTDNYTTQSQVSTERIGNYDPAVLGFGGYIDDFRRYTRRLTPAEIRLLASKRGIGLQPTRSRRIPEEIAAAGVANPVLFYNHYTNQGFF